MGKYMKKSKSPGEVKVKDASQSPVGVRTRAKTLALRRLRSSAASVPSKSDLGYLELRSRRLVKRPPPLRKYMQSSRVVSFANNDDGFSKGENGEFGSRKGCSGSGLGSKSGSVGPGKGEDAFLLRKSSRALESGDLGIEISSGSNNSKSEDRDMSHGERSRCSFIKVADSSTIPGSTMKQTSIAPSTIQRVQNARFVDMPTTDEIEEFFARAEQSWQHLFIEKYNFDVVNDLPLPGRYEWVKTSP